MAGAPAFDASPVTQRTAEEDVAHMRSQIDSRRQALYATSELREYWHKLWEGLCKHRPVPQHLWCLGIGPFSHPASAYQWAVLLEFQDALKVSMTAVLTAQSYHNRSVPLTVYDPQFASRDIALVKSLGAQLPPSNKVCVKKTETVRRLRISASYAHLHASLPEGALRGTTSSKLEPTAAADPDSVWQ